MKSGEVAQAWSDDELARLREAWTANLHSAEVAVFVGRSRNACLHKAGTIGLPRRHGGVKRGCHYGNARGYDEFKPETDKQAEAWSGIQFEDVPIVRRYSEKFMGTPPDIISGMGNSSALCAE